jgi:hypothetical protein
MRNYTETRDPRTRATQILAELTDREVRALFNECGRRLNYIVPTVITPEWQIADEWNHAYEVAFANGLTDLEECPPVVPAVLRIARDHELMDLYQEDLADRHHEVLGEIFADVWARAAAGEPFWFTAAQPDGQD